MITSSRFLQFNTLFLLTACGLQSVSKVADDKESADEGDGSRFAETTLGLTSPTVGSQLFKLTGEGVVENPEACNPSFGAGGNYREGTTFLSGKCQNEVLPVKIRGPVGNRFLEFSTNGRISAAGNDRSELALGSMIPFDRTYYVSFDYKVPGDAQINNTMFYALQFWQCAPLSPIAGVRLLPRQRGVLNFMVRHQNDPSGKGVGNFQTTPNVWHSFVMGVRPNPAGNGRVEVWADGTKIIDQSLPFGSNQPGACEGNGGIPNLSHRLKFGIYKGAEAGVFRSLFDNVVGGTSLFRKPISGANSPTSR